MRHNYHPVLDVGCSCSVHSGRCRPLDSYRLALESPLCFWHLYVRVYLDSNFILKHSSVKLYNSWLNEKTVNLIFLASKGIQKRYFLLFKLRKALWRASCRRGLFQDSQWQAKFCSYVLSNTVRYIRIGTFRCQWHCNNFDYFHCTQEKDTGK